MIPVSILENLCYSISCLGVSRCPIWTCSVNWTFAADTADNENCNWSESLSQTLMTRLKSDSVSVTITNITVVKHDGSVSQCFR